MKCRIQKAGLCLSFFFLLVLMMPFVVVAEMDTVDIMIQGTSSISFDRGDAKATKEDGYIELTAGAGETYFYYPVNQNVDMNQVPYLYFNVETNGGWDIQFLSSAAYDDIMPGFSSDFGPDFGVKEGQYGELLPSGSYLPGDVPIYAKGAYTWNENLPENGVVTIKQVLIRVEARKTLRLYELYFGEEMVDETEEGDPAAAEEGAADGLGKDSELVAGRVAEADATDQESDIVTAALWIIIAADIILLPGAYLLSRLPKRQRRQP